VITFKVGDEVSHIATLKTGIVTEIVTQSWPDADPFSLSRLPDLYIITFSDGTTDLGSSWTYDLLEPEPNSILKALV